MLRRHRPEVARVGGVDEGGGVQETEAEPAVDPEAGGVLSPAGVGEERAGV